MKRYPMRNDYDTAIRNLNLFVFDDYLKAGKPVAQKHNPKLLRSYNGEKAIVYEIETNPKKYALKCWVKDLGNLKNRYKEIDKYLKFRNLPYFTKFAYQEDGILVNGSRYPIVRMEWVEGVSLKSFIASNITNPINIRRLAEDFLKIVKDLHQNEISHGDLQHRNIKVGTDGKIRLIDYDSMYVPNLASETDDIKALKGLPGYQHPARNSLTCLSLKADYFSELVVYLSLLAISEKPSYWKHIKKEERLLFSQDDFINPRSSSVFSELKKLSPEIKYFTGELEHYCEESDLKRLKPLEHLVDAYTGSRRDDVIGTFILLEPNDSITDTRYSQIWYTGKI
jgi:serine/threonine protein kinase